MLRFIYSPLVGDIPKPHDRLIRLALFLMWCGLVAWFLADHVFWRDEVRALTLALSGSNIFEMLRNVQGEGHPALWYLLLRVAHDIVPYREVLPILGALIGVAAMAVVTFLSPFRLPIIGIVLFSYYGAFEYVVVARNYGIAALVMFLIAASYGRARDSLWFGVLVAILANTNVPGCILAGFFLMFCFVELLTNRSTNRSQWTMFAGNAAIAAIGALLCFVTVYPPFNDGAVSANLATLSIGSFGAALVDISNGFRKLGIGQPLLNLLLFCSCLAFVRRPSALVASLGGLVVLKLFFYFVYNSDYRHEALFLLFLLSLHWITLGNAGSDQEERRPLKFLRLSGVWAFVALLFLQSVLLITPVLQQSMGIPYSGSAGVAEILRRPEFEGAILMGDPDTVLDAFPYYVDNPAWLLREQRFGRVARLIKDSRAELTMDDVLADAKRLHQQTGRPVIYLSMLNMERWGHARYNSMFHNFMTVTPESRARFRSSTRLIARLRPTQVEEEYDVYVYPRSTAPVPGSPPAP